MDTLEYYDAPTFFATLGPHIMTPQPMVYYQNDNLWIELSTGKGMFGEDLFGVMVWAHTTTPPTYEADMSKLHFSRKDAGAHIRKLLGAG